jgi:outer membrane receptor protein involved in Fe transport
MNGAIMAPSVNGICRCCGISSGVEVVRGPGSVLYGPDALTMVINIITENANTFQGTEVTSRIGAFDEFYAGEIKWGKKFDDKSGLYLYFGAADQQDAQGYQPGKKNHRQSPTWRRPQYAPSPNSDWGLLWA